MGIYAMELSEFVDATEAAELKGKSKAIVRVDPSADTFRVSAGTSSGEPFGELIINGVRYEAWGCVKKASDGRWGIWTGERGNEWYFSIRRFNSVSFQDYTSAAYNAFKRICAEAARLYEEQYPDNVLQAAIVDCAHQVEYQEERVREAKQALEEEERKLAIEQTKLQVARDKAGGA